MLRSKGPLRTSDVARLVGVSPDTIRIYERRGVLPRPRRAPNGYREYGPEAADRVRLVRRALAIGFTLDELRVVLGARDRGEAPCRVVRTLAAEKLEALQVRIDDLIGLRDNIERVLRDWDARLGATPQGRPARLLEALTSLVAEGDASPFIPGHRRRR